VATSSHIQIADRAVLVLVLGAELAPIREALYAV
jgi:hypothetical protein